MKIAKDRRIYFRGVPCDEVGARLIEMPQVTYAVPRGKKVTIPGRDGYLWLSDGGYDTTTVKVTLAVPNGDNLPRVMDWLSGYGPLIIGDAPEFYYKARVITAGQCINIAPHLTGKKLQATFTCDPFRYMVNEEPLVYDVANTPSPYVFLLSDYWENNGTYVGWSVTDQSYEIAFPGAGTVWSRPVITITPARNTNHVFTINGWTFQIGTNINQTIVIDCVGMRVYRINNGSNTNISKYVTIVTDEDDEWPRLYPAGQTNVLHWPYKESGNDIAQIKVVPNWRWR